MKIKSGENKEVLISGTVLTFDKEPLTFEIEKDLIFKIDFRYDPDTAGTRITFDLNLQKVLTIICINFDNPMGVGTNTPLHIGIKNNKKLYLTFIVHTRRLPDTKVDNITKTIHYTFYLGEEVKNG